MFSIGEFSKINRISTKTLRYYDKINILKPDYVDEINGYRYYTGSQLRDLHQIITLKQIGLSLGQIRRVIEKDESLRDLLDIKEKYLLESIRREEDKLLQLRTYLKLMEEGKEYMYNAVLKELPKVKVASMRRLLEKYDDLFDIVPTIMGKEMERLGCICASPPYCFNIYHDGEYKESDIDVEICESVTEIKEDNEILKFKTIEAVETSACVLHKGPYNRLGEAYSFIYKWIYENKYQIIGPPRESFIDGIWNKDSEDDWLTEIQVPVKKLEN